MDAKILDFSTYSSIKIGPKISIQIAQNAHEIDELQKNGYKIIGGANNVLLNEHRDFRLFLLGREFDYILDSSDFIEVGARTAGKKLFAHAKKNNLSGFEFLSALPGTLGGIIKMNAGMKELEIAQVLQSVNVHGEWIAREKIPFEYRKSGINGVILAARFNKNNGFSARFEKLCREMRRNQPKDPSCGSCFKNPQNESAGKLLECAGLRGFKIGEMCFSQKHANFLINTGGGTFAQSIELINLAKKRVFEDFGITLENEIIIFE